MNFLTNIRESISKSTIATENLQAMKNEVLRKCGIKVCELMTTNICSFMPDSWRLKIIMSTTTGRQVATVLLSQLIGTSLYAFREGLSPANQKYLDMMRQSAWMASATAMLDITNIDRLFDMLVPKEMKKFLDDSMSQINTIEKRLETETPTDNK